MAGRMTAPQGDRDAILAAVQAVMSRVFGVPPQMITEATRCTDIERWDSLNLVLVSIGLERRLDIPVDVATCSSVRTVKALIDALCAPRSI
jgi:acyl carrier protein